MASPDVPLRPMTAGELLDAGTALLRRVGLPLLGAAAVLATAEQALLAPLRARAGLDPPYLLWDGVTSLEGWTVTALGLGTEAAVVTLLAGLAAAAVGPVLLGHPVRRRELWRRARPLPLPVAAAAVGTLVALGSFLGLLPGLLLLGLLGLTAPALVVDRVGGPFGAVGRSVALAVRGGLRVVRLRLLAYAVWTAVRLALGAGWTGVFETVTGAGGADRLTPFTWVLADTVAYAALACVDAVLLVEARIRTEGLDIAVARARSRGEDDAAVLVRVP